ncbi:cwf18 pre-mRNA splicing factor-domain-containing protein [Xylariaceae sp. FL0804]|nr:cwf18 pre-mRNA splicing factor-domain-containing protein [Xylariaceae sp. FL0804]
MPATHATLSAASDDRKARLAKLKTLKRKQPGDEVAAPESERSGSPPSSAPLAAAAAAESAEPGHDESTAGPLAPPPAPAPPAANDDDDAAVKHLSLRNYDAATRGARLGFEAPPTLGLEGPTLEEQAAAVEAEARRRAADEARDDRGIDLFRLQPRKPNWDLRRDLDAKLAVLAVRTDNAIARLVRERIAGAQAAARDSRKNNTTVTAERAPGAAGGAGADDGEAAGMDGVALVEGLRVREREEEEEERREREDPDLA